MGACRRLANAFAKEEWEHQGCPIIDWQRLPSRLLSHSVGIKRRITGKRSHFRNKFATIV